MDNSSKVFFYNKGDIDLLALKTFGISSKESKNPIGYFGTGLKYALAILMREGARVTLCTGGVCHEFSVREQTFRKDSFQMIYCGDDALPFTTELGKNWSLWQAYRELFSNAKDEGGDAFLGFSGEPIPGETLITVDHPEFYKVHENQELYFTFNRKPIYVSPELTIYDYYTPHIFYKGVRAKENRVQPCFTYSIAKGCDLTEDRSLVYDFQIHEQMCKAFIECTDREIIRKVVTASQYSYEYELPFGEYCRDHKVDKDALFFDVVEEQLTRSRFDVSPGAYGAHRRMRGYKEPHHGGVKVTDLDKRVLDKATKFLADIGYEIEFPIKVVDHLGEGVMALAENGTIYLTKHIMNTGVRHVARGILEEYFHLKYGYHDCSRSFQNFLFDNLITLGAQLVEETI